MRVYDKKVATEDEFRTWVSEDEARVKKYGEALDLIENAYHTNKNIELNRTYLNEAIWRGAEIMYWSFRMNRAIAELPAGYFGARNLLAVLTRQLAGRQAASLPVARREPWCLP